MKYFSVYLVSRDSLSMYRLKHTYIKASFVPFKIFIMVIFITFALKKEIHFDNLFIHIFLFTMKTTQSQNENLFLLIY